MTQQSVPVLCAGCEATIVVTPDMLDGAYACEQCGAAIDFTLYEPLEAMLEERRIASRLAKEIAEAEKKTSARPTKSDRARRGGARQGRTRGNEATRDGASSGTGSRPTP